MSVKKVMFICTANSCRSQMAEGFAREYGRGLIEVYSAGLMAAGVHHRAAAVMKELGIDISKQKSKEIDAELLLNMDYAITLCSYAETFCPKIIPGVNRLHWPIKDPVSTSGSENFIMDDFRRARDEIKEKVLELINRIRISG